MEKISQKKIESLRQELKSIQGIEASYWREYVNLMSRFVTDLANDYFSPKEVAEILIRELAK